MLLASFIIVNYNGKKFIKRLIDSLYSQSLKSFEIIVVDNGSTDGSVKYIASSFPKVRLIISQNIGYGLGCNLGAKKATGKYVYFINPDIYFPKNFLKDSLKFYELSSKTLTSPMGCVGFAVADYDSSPAKITNYGGGIIDIFGTPRNYLQSELDSMFIFGACMLMTREIFKKTGGFNPNLFLYGEEIDLCWRLKIMGYVNVIDTKDYFFHVGGGSDFGKNRPRQVALMTLGCFIDSVTNYQTITLILLFPFYVGYLLLLLIFLPLFHQYNLRFSQELFNTFINLRHQSKNIISFRQFVQKKRTISDFDIRHNISFIPSTITRLKLFT